MQQRTYKRSQLPSMEDIQHFQDTVYSYWKHEGRHDLPWRQTSDPYAICVSELMLQQTQVPRVIEKYIAWMKRFPTVDELFQATMSELLSFWVGLGYNRRALYLKKIAEIVVKSDTKQFPTTYDDLLLLPGIGDYTARAICVFAYNQALPLIETNVRTVMIHHFFTDQEAVDDVVIWPLIELSLADQDPRTWFSALMDYGSHLKSVLPNPSRKSKQFTQQSPLKGSVREVRGYIIKQQSQGVWPTLTSLKCQFPDSEKRIEKAIAGLEKDGLLIKKIRVKKSGKS